MKLYAVLLIAVFIVLTVLKVRRTLRRGVDAINSSTYITPEVFGQLASGVTVPMASVFPIMTRFLNPAILPSIRPNPAYSAAPEGWRYVWSEMIPSARAENASSLMTVIVAQMPKSVNGTIYWTRHPALGGSWKLADPMESIEFNNGLKVMASNRPLAQSVLSPDFMAWILDHQQPDMLFFREQFCLMYFAADRTTDDVVRDVHSIIKFVNHSGALVKNP